MTEYSAYCETLGGDCRTKALCVWRQEDLSTRIAAAEDPSSIPLMKFARAVFSRQPALSGEKLEAAKGKLALTEAVLELNCTHQCLLFDALLARQEEFFNQ